MSLIDPTAIVHPDASIGENVTIGPFAIIEAAVTIGNGCTIGPYTRIEGPTLIGERNHFGSHGAIGCNPQDLKYKGEPTELHIGTDNTFREFVTIARGTVGGGGLTTIASHVYFMAYSHVAHDSHIGSHVLFANAATTAGHVEIGDYAQVGAFSAVHQFCRVGDHAFIGGFTAATQDVLPYVKTVGSRPAKSYGINTVGLERRGFERQTIEALQRAYRIVVRSKLKLEDALRRIDEELSIYPETRYFAEFIRDSKRGIIR